jgi:uncharacterized protein (TIGR00369 family)|tara:strand:+ start:2175 stop:2750 length:576 start_codon:yes stop_codon:yes gene_type:complete
VNFLKTSNMKIKTVSYSKTTITELMIPSYANFSGKVHGGILLSLMDKVAFACAAKHSGSYCVTVAVEGVEFLQPVEVGELVSLKASVNYVGNSSMIIGIRIDSMNPRTSISKHTNSCFFTMVAKDEDGSPKKVAELKLETHEELKRFVEGKILKKLSKEKRKLLDEEVENYSESNLLTHCENERCDVSNLR